MVDPNPLFTGFASFSSRGVRNGDSGLKPDITAPGVSITSDNAAGAAEAQLSPVNVKK